MAIRDEVNSPRSGTERNTGWENTAWCTAPHRQAAGSTPNRDDSEAIVLSKVDFNNAEQSPPHHDRPSGESTKGTNSKTGEAAQGGMPALARTALWNAFIQAASSSGCGAFSAI